MNTELVETADRALAALLNGVYQGALVTAGVWLCLRWLRSTNAATRHAIWLTTLAAVATLPILHLGLAERQRLAARSGTPATPEPRPVGSTGRPSASYDYNPDAKTASFQADAPATTTGATAKANLVLDPDPAVQPPDEDSSAAEAPEEDTWPVQESHEDFPVLASNNAEESSIRTESQPVAREEATTPAQKATEITNKAEPWWIPTPARISVPAYLGIATLLLVGAIACFRLATLARQCLALCGLKRHSPAAPEYVQERLRHVSSQAGTKRSVDLVTSNEVRSPIVIGFWRPAIVIPEALLNEKNPERLDPILRHEFAHIQRRDDWSNLLQQAAVALFCFNPAVWWISRRLSIEREIACDDHVLQSGHKPRDYAWFLTEFAGQARGRDWNAAPAAWRRKSQLTERVNMILNKNRSTSTRLARAGLGIVGTTAAAFAVLLLQAAPRLSFASDAPAPSAGLASGALPATAAPHAEGLAPGVAAVAAAPPGADVLTPGELPVTAAPHAEALTPHMVAVTAAPRIETSGPRPKDPTQPDWPSPAVAPVPAAPQAMIVQAPNPPYALNPPHAMNAPSPTPAPGRHGPRVAMATSDSLENRLARVERMLEELMAQRGRADVHIDQKDLLDKHNELLIEQGHRQAELRASADARKDAGKRSAEAQRLAKEGKFDAAKAALEQQQHALEAQHKALEKQVQALEKQMERLEQERDRLDEQKDRLEEEKDRLEEEKDRMKEEKDRHQEARDAAKGAAEEEHDSVQQTGEEHDSASAEEEHEESESEDAPKQ
jgi:beta-lactamase regulating signal transducer with metallopeptidase domain